MTCGCLEHIDEELKTQNGRIARGFTINRELSIMDLSPPMITVEKIGRGKKPPIVLATFCPFCGAKYKQIT